MYRQHYIRLQLAHLNIAHQYPSQLLTRDVSFRFIRPQQTHPLSEDIISIQPLYMMANPILTRTYFMFIAR